MCMFAPRMYRTYNTFEEDESTRRVINNMEKHVKRKNNVALGLDSKRSTRTSSPFAQNKHSPHHNESQLGSVKIRARSGGQTLDQTLSAHQTRLAMTSPKNLKTLESLESSDGGDTNPGVVLVV